MHFWTSDAFLDFIKVLNKKFFQKIGIFGKMPILLDLHRRMVLEASGKVSSKTINLRYSVMQKQR